MNPLKSAWGTIISGLVIATIIAISTTSITSTHIGIISTMIISITNTTTAIIISMLIMLPNINIIQPLRAFRRTNLR